MQIIPTVTGQNHCDRVALLAEVLNLPTLPPAMPRAPSKVGGRIGKARGERGTSIRNALDSNDLSPRSRGKAFFGLLSTPTSVIKESDQLFIITIFSNDYGTRFGPIELETRGRHSGGQGNTTTSSTTPDNLSPGLPAPFEKALNEFSSERMWPSRISRPLTFKNIPKGLTSLSGRDPTGFGQPRAFTTWGPIMAAPSAEMKFQTEVGPHFVCVSWTLSL